MSKDNFDAETERTVSEAEALEAMFQSSGWAIAERELNEIIAALRDTRSVPREGDVLLNLEVRDKTASAMEEWVDILKGQVNNVIILKDEPEKNKIIERR